VSRLFELLGCDFPTEFKVLRCSVVNLSDQKRLELDSRGRKLAARHQRPGNSYSSGSWCLLKTESLDETVVHHGAMSFTTSWDQVLNEFWPELLILALCCSGRFTISNVIEANPGWKLKTITLADPYSDSSPFSSHLAPRKDETEWSAWLDDFYGITSGDWAQFQQGVAVTQKAFTAAIREKTWELQSLRETARWHLRGRLMEHESLNRDEYADVLLRYVTGLENFLMLPSEKESIGEKLRSRAAWMVGRNEVERKSIFDFIKDVYDARSHIVHRGSAKKKRKNCDIDLRRLRDICRRAMACALLVTGEAGEAVHLDDFLRNLMISQKYQQLAQHRAERIGRLTRCF